MFKKKKSFFERLTGNVRLDEDYDAFEDDFAPEPKVQNAQKKVLVNNEPTPRKEAEEEKEEPAQEGQLPVDVYQSPSEIVVRAFVAGVKGNTLDISITRDMVTISGAREPREDVDQADYFHKELYWGAFTRTILLPEEIDVDGASASAKDGLLTMILPKLDKKKQTKLTVKSG